MRNTALFILVSLLFSCQQVDKIVPLSKEAAAEPEHVEVQHILVAFKGSLPGKELERSKEEAKKLADEIFEKLQKDPSQFDELLTAHSDDMIPGIYLLANKDVQPGKNEIPRDQFRKAFGDLAFKMEVGKIGFIPHHEEDAPYGFHIVKRLK